VLGVKPGVSDRELKAAHRDLAKVWHPDRFLHDPRLQEKAQEKLKEINEAYEQLISRHKQRVSPPPPPRPRAQRAQTSSVEDVVVQRRRGAGWHWYVALALVVFGVVFALTTQKLVRQRQQATDTTHVEEEVARKRHTPFAIEVRTTQRRRLKQLLKPLLLLPANRLPQFRPSQW